MPSNPTSRPERFSILVVWADGVEEYVRQGTRTAVFPSRAHAKEQADFMKIGMEGDPDVESISVVFAPKE